MAVGTECIPPDSIIGNHQQAAGSVCGYHQDLGYWVHVKTLTVSPLYDQALEGQCVSMGGQNFGGTMKRLVRTAAKSYCDWKVILIGAGKGAWKLGCRAN